LCEKTGKRRPPVEEIVLLVMLGEAKHLWLMV